MKHLNFILIAVLSVIALSCSEKTSNEGMVWPDGQAFPQFAAPADTLDAIWCDSRRLSHEDVLMLTTLQGVVNSIQPRIFFLAHNRGGRSEWVDRIGLNVREIPSADKFELVRKYASDLKGAVVYSTEKSIHYINLATTVAGLKGAVAVTAEQLSALDSAGVSLSVVEDLRNLPYTETTEIYKYMYDTIWKDCTRRTLLSLSPRVSGDIRDMAVATGAAVVWLDPREEDERAVLEPFIEDLVPGESVMLGWWHEERAGIGLGAKHGISTVPSDFYTNSTVFAGAPHEVNLAPVPKRPALENKVYVALFLSDGDNVQYCEHTMCRLWDNEERGTFPINWTLSPALVDLGPQMLNYYNETATDNDCLVSGPSGMGYAMFYDGLNLLWNASDRETIEPYTKLTQNYLEKSGIRVVTVWDVLSDEQMEAYAENCRYLYGATLEDWGRSSKVPTSTKAGKLAFLPNRPPYTGKVEYIFNEWKDTVSTFTGAQPVFLTAQGVSWNMGPRQMVHLQSMFDEIAPGTVEICRADHFFSYFNEANGMDFNLMLKDEVEVKTSTAQVSAALLSDGSASEAHTWVADSKGRQTIDVDLKQAYLLDRYVIRKAGQCKIRVETSLDGKTWAAATQPTYDSSDVADIDITPVEARFVRFSVLSRGAIAHIGDLELYGRTL